MNNFYLCHDSETGGLGLDKSLLTAYFGVFDREFNPIGKTITIVGTGVLSTRATKNDTITIEYAVPGYTDSESELVSTESKEI